MNYEEQRWEVIANPREEWIYHYDAGLAIIPHELWFAAAERRARARQKSPLTGRRPSRNENQATTLFSGTLFCDYCEGRELVLVHSDSKYKSIGCLQGHARSHGCQLTTSKSTRIIENCLVPFIFDTVLTDDRMEQLVADANHELAILAAQPARDTTGLVSQARTLERNIRRYHRLIEEADDDCNCKSYHGRIRELQGELNSIHARLQEAEQLNQAPQAPLDLACVKGKIQGLRELLNQSIPLAAEAIRALTGPITIRQEKVPGKNHGARWIATFTPHFLDFLAKMGKSMDSPDSITLEFLSARIWTNSSPVTVVIEELHPYELHASDVKRLHDGDGVTPGISLNVISAKLGISYSLASNALKFAKMGARPIWPKKLKRSTKGGKRPVEYKSIAAEVARLHDEEKLGLERIARERGWSENLVRRAYYYARPDLIEAAAKSGTQIKCGSYSNLAEGKLRRVRELIAQGRKIKDIAVEVGCGDNTVRRVKKRMQEASARNS